MAKQTGITIMIEIAGAIRPCSPRAIAYQLFNRKLIPSMVLKHTRRVARMRREITARKQPCRARIFG